MGDEILCECGNNAFLCMKMQEGSEMLPGYFEGRPMMECNQCGQTYKLHYRIDGICLHQVDGLTEREEKPMSLADLFRA